MELPPPNLNPHLENELRVGASASFEAGEQSLQAARIESWGQKRKRKYLQAFARDLKTPEPSGKDPGHLSMYPLGTADEGYEDFPGGDLRRANLPALLEPIFIQPAVRYPYLEKRVSSSTTAKDSTMCSIS